MAQLLGLLLFAALSVWLSAIDLTSQRLPTPLCVAALASGLLSGGLVGLFSGDRATALRPAAAAAALCAFYLLLHLLHPTGIGGGDVRLAAALGANLGGYGWHTLPLATLAAFLLGGLVALGFIATDRAWRKRRLPFGPCMIAGSWIGLLADPGRTLSGFVSPG